MRPRHVLTASTVLCSMQKHGVCPHTVEDRIVCDCSCHGVPLPEKRQMHEAVTQMAYELLYGYSERLPDLTIRGLVHDLIALYQDGSSIEFSNAFLKAVRAMEPKGYWSRDEFLLHTAVAARQEDGTYSTDPLIQQVTAAAVEHEERTMSLHGPGCSYGIL